MGVLLVIAIILWFVAICAGLAKIVKALEKLVDVIDENNKLLIELYKDKNKETDV